MQNKLKGLDIEIISLDEIGGNIPYVDECGSSPLENATLKAKVYYEYYQMPVFPVIAVYILRIYRLNFHLEFMSEILTVSD